MGQQLIEKKFFAAIGEQSGQLDADSAPFAVGINSWVNMQDFRIGSTDKGVTMVAESVGGTLRLSTPSPSVSFIELGKEEDIVRNRIIYFYYNTTTTEHKIEVYDKTANVIYLALLSSQITGGLNFNKSFPIHSARVAGNVIYWTDNYNEPKKLNIDAAIKMNNPSYSTSEAAYINPLEAEVDYIIRKPPNTPLVGTKFTQPSVLVNDVENFAGMFAWRYLFRDGEKSVASTPSNFLNYNTPTEVYNLITVVANMSEHINQDVQQVDFLVRYGNSGNYFVIKSWNKNVSVQAAQIANHNAGIAGLNYSFYNDKIGLALDAAYSYKPFDSVPLLSRGLEISLSRLLLGYNLEAYNSPVLSSLSVVPFYENTLPFQNPIMKAGGTKKLGIVFRDRFKRVIGNVFTNDNLRVTVNDRDYDYATYCSHFNWTLGSGARPDEIPVEAYYYEVVITRELTTRFFMEARSINLKYIIKNVTTGVFSFQDNYTSGAYGVAVNIALLESESMGYLFEPTSGDIMKLYKLGDPTVYKLPVIGQEGNWVFIKLENLGNFTPVLSGTDKFIFEIFTPYKEVGDDPFYTTGLLYTITNPGLSTRFYQTGGAAIYGDVYLYNRATPYGTYRAENMSSNNKHWKEWLGNWGEVNINLTSKQVRKNTAVRWSNVLIEGTQTNGLSSFDALDEKILPLDLGALQKLMQTSKVQEQGNIVLAIGEDDTASLYMGEVQVVGADRNAFLSSAPNVIGTVNVLKGNFGTIDPETVFEYRGNVYWLDRSNGRVIQYSLNGLFPISNYKMTRFWKLWCQKRNSMTAAEVEAFGGRPFVFFTVDPAHDELLISIPKLSNTPPKGYLPDYPSTIYPFDPLDYQQKVMVYDLKESRWLGSYSFYAEGFATLQNELYSFRFGQLYLHNQYNNQANYYGVQYTPKIMCVANQNPTKPKVYHNVSVESNIVPLSMYFYNSYPIQQSSDLVDFSFRNVEGNWCANILRNKLVPTATGFNTNGLLTAEVMRNVAMYVMAEFSVSGSNPVQLKFLNIGYIPSVGNTTV